MNIVASNGKVHRISGTRTACKTRIRDCWQTTDEPLTCVRCGAPEPEPEPELPGKPEAAAEIQPMTIADMLLFLGAVIVGTGDMVVIQVIPGMPQATVEVPHSDLRNWCERRIKSRLSHKNKCINGGGGLPVLGKIRVS